MDRLGEMEIKYGARKARSGGMHVRFGKGNRGVQAGNIMGAWDIQSFPSRKKWLFELLHEISTFSKFIQMGLRIHSVFLFVQSVMGRPCSTEIPQLTFFLFLFSGSPVPRTTYQSLLLKLHNLRPDNLLEYRLYCTPERMPRIRKCTVCKFGHSIGEGLNFNASSMSQPSMIDLAWM